MRACRHLLIVCVFHVLVYQQSFDLWGTFFPRRVTNASTWNFTCVLSGVDLAFVSVDGHVVCQHGAYNNSNNGHLDGTPFRMLHRRALVVRARVVRTSLLPVDQVMSVALHWCLQGMQLFYFFPGLIRTCPN